MRAKKRSFVLMLDVPFMLSFSECAQNSGVQSGDYAEQSSLADALTN
ncbi:MAG: hypothetical protein AAGU32_14175 [Bacillota bacterium]